MTAYTLTPLGASGVDERRSEVVHGPSLRDSLTRAELSRRLVAQAEELAAVRKQLVIAQAAARHMERMRLRMDNECALRVRSQRRLDDVALGLAVIAVVHPEAAGTVEVVREAIWRLGDV